MRAVGGIGLSVGTSLVFEENGPALLNRVDCLLFNLKTLIRNAFQAYEKDDREAFDPKQLVTDVESDLKLIGKWLEEARSNKPIRMVVYCPSYKNLKSEYKYADIWEPRTEKQKKVESVYKDTVDILIKKYDKLVVQTKDTLPEYKGNGLVLTHHPVDLVKVRGVGRLNLVESYTGVIKPFTDWNTKLTGGDKLNYMPLNRLTIQIFGDKSVNFRTQSSAIKELVKQIAIDNKWTTATTLTRVRATISALPAGVSRTGLLNMF